MLGQVTIHGHHFTTTRFLPSDCAGHIHAGLSQFYAVGIARASRDSG
jgi:hypothetical protein